VSGGFIVGFAQRDYRSVRQDVQDTVQEALSEFAALCAAWIQSPRLAHVRVRAD
jgi:hypothetical protein